MAEVKEGNSVLFFFPKTAQGGKIALDTTLSADPKTELQRESWSGVLNDTTFALAFFHERGHKRAGVIRACVVAVSEAIHAAVEHEEPGALKKLAEAEVSFARLNKQIDPNNDSHCGLSDRAIRHGCGLALEYLKNAMLSCLRSVLRNDAGELFKAQVSLEHAAVSILAAKKMATLQFSAGLV